MAPSSADFHAALGVFQGCLLVSVQADLYDDLLIAIREQTLRKIHSKTVKGVVFDMSSVKVMDTFVFKHLVDTGKMALILGVEAVFSGFQPGVVSALVDMEAETEMVNSFRTCEEALAYLTSCLSARQECDDDECDVPVQSAGESECENDESAAVKRYA